MDVYSDDIGPQEQVIKYNGANLSRKMTNCLNPGGTEMANIDGSAHHHGHEHRQEKDSRPWYKVGLWGALIILGYFLFTEHRAHTIQFFPYLFLLACPLMHIFMHGGHGSHNHNKTDEEK